MRNRVVYRVETIDSVGPYSVIDLSHHSGSRNMKKWPNPSREKFRDYRNNKIEPNYILNCGFATFRKFLNWFGNDIQRLVDSSETLYLCVYKVGVEHVIKGTKQVMFDMSQATLMKRIRI